MAHCGYCACLSVEGCLAYLVFWSHILKELYVVLRMELGHIWSRGRMRMVYLHFNLMFRLRPATSTLGDTGWSGIEHSKGVRLLSRGCRTFQQGICIHLINFYQSCGTALKDVH